jgi:hypothetical protein
MSLSFQKQAFSLVAFGTGNASALGSANQIDRLTKLEGLDGRLFSLAQFSDEQENSTFL